MKRRDRQLSRRDVALQDRLMRWPTRTNKLHILRMLQSEHGRITYIYHDPDDDDEIPESRWCRLDPSYRHPMRIRK